MRARLFALLIFLAIPLHGGKDRTLTPGQAANGLAAITATAYIDSGAIKQLLGSDLGGYYTVLQVTLTPKGGKLKVDPDDFVLRTDKDGEHTHPMAPSQIAGETDMVLHEVQTPTVGTQNNGPVWGGVPGTSGAPGTRTGPRQLPGNGGGVGNGEGGSTATATTSSKKDNDHKPDPMLDVLKRRVIHAQETDQPVSGLLIFNLEKQKLKDLELVYTTAEGPLKVRFK